MPGSVARASETGYSLVILFLLSDAGQGLSLRLSLTRLQIEHNWSDLVLCWCGRGGRGRGRTGLRCLIGRDVAKNAAESDSLALISQRETTESAAVGDLLDGDGCLHADSNEALGEGAGELGHVFLGFFTSVGVLLDGPLDVLDVNVVCISMNMHHALGALGEDGPLEFEKLELALEYFGCHHGSVSGAEHVTLENLILVQVADLELHVVAGASVGDLLLLVVDDVEDLAGEVPGRECETIAETNSTLLHLAEDDRTVRVLHLVEDGDAEGRLSISVLADGHIIEDVEEGGPRVPAAHRIVDWLNDVLTSESGDGHPEEVIS